MKRKQNLKLLNIGCGSVYHSDWINLDIVSSMPYVQFYDIRRGLPFADAEIGVCYSSHVIEHLKPSEAKNLLAECARVLKPDGILRIVVPDLESIVRHYIEALELVKAGASAFEPNYDWMMLELLDQTVRNTSGGEMGRYLLDPDIPNKEFVATRIGMQATLYWREGPKAVSKKPALWWQRLKTKGLPVAVRQLRLRLAKMFVYCLAGAEAQRSFDEGLFRSTGEIHRWMYDSFSLGRLLAQSGFVDIQVCRADESRIADFNRYELDVIGRHVRKPDSLFMEAYKV